MMRGKTRDQRVTIPLAKVVGVVVVLGIPCCALGRSQTLTTGIAKR